MNIAASAVGLGILAVCLCGCLSEAGLSAAADSKSHAEGGSAEQQDDVIVVTSPVRKDVVNTQPYVCQIHSRQHIEVRALERGYLQQICVKEGQAVKKGELMFKIMPRVYQARLESEEAEVQRAEIELQNTEALFKKGIVAQPEVAMKKADVVKAKGKLGLAQAELSFTDVAAPFDGIVDRQQHQLGSLIEEGGILTTLSDNSLMWVYFNVPEAQYLHYKVELDKKAELDKNDENKQHLQIQLKLADGKIFPEPGKIGAIEADFNNKTGNISFRADFPNPKGLLRNGQTGTVLIHTTSKDVVVIPQRATFEILAKRYAFVVDENDVVHQREITIQTSQEDIFVVQSGLDEKDKIVLEGIRHVRDGEKIKYKFRSPDEVLGNLKFHAE
jgi:membrane fusion protein (multidrug efflux system)